MNIEYSMTDQEAEDPNKEILRTHDFEHLWQQLEDMGDDRGRMSIVATVDDPDEEEDGDVIGILNGFEVWEDGEEAFE